MTRLWGSGTALLALCMLFWAGSVVVGRAAAELIPPMLFTLLRWGGAFLICLPFAWPHLSRDRAALRARWWLPLVLGLLGVVTYNSLVYRGLHATTAVNAVLLQSATPLLVLVAGMALYRERPSVRELVAIGVSVAGVAVIAGQGSVETLLHLRINPGDLMVLVAVSAYALYSALLRLRPAVHPMSLLAASIGPGVLVLLPMAWAEHASGARMVGSRFAWASAVYAAVFPGFLAYLFFNRGVELVGATRAGQMMHLMPAFGIGLSIVFLGERLAGFHLVGVGLIAVGLGLAAQGR